MTKKIILLNGPPRSGKDTAANLLMNEYVGRAMHLKLSAPLKDSMRHMMGIDNLIELKEIMENKEDAYDALFGMSAREFQIWLSEEVMKYKFGSYVFGIILANRIKAAPDDKNLFIVSDSGFASEAGVLIHEFGHENVFQLVLEKEGTSFDNDSRDYWNDHRILSDHAYNNHSIEAFRERILEIVDGWIND